MSSLQMNFPAALQEVIDGKRVTRLEWNDPNIYVLLWNGYLSIKNYTGYHRLLVGDGDLFSDDWIVVLAN